MHRIIYKSNTKVPGNELSELPKIEVKHYKKNLL